MVAEFVESNSIKMGQLPTFNSFADYTDAERHGQNRPYNNHLKTGPANDRTVAAGRTDGLQRAVGGAL